ncbi:MAG: ThuA domain-containing protein [Planctomycetota bacterium]|nr:ThuA domain-containing protein [Planctomycetota bacterium]
MTLSRSLPAHLWLPVVLLAAISQAQPVAGQTGTASEKQLQLHLRSQVPEKKDSPAYQYRFEAQQWDPRQTAIVVCDFWDYHHCLNAVRRMKEFGPRLNTVIETARRQGVTIIHSPSDCMESYRDHPARQRAIQAPASQSPPDISSWCSRIPTEEAATYPIDQSDGGEDDDPKEHREWASKLESLGRNPNLPWKSQNTMIPIDRELDLISDRGQEVWNILQDRKIRNVILVGVHTNMCVLGRPFGLRQMKRNGLNVVLMRDMTDTMYNPQRWPYVSHYTGTDLVISHIEKHVCPTISSDQILGGREFRFPSDPRPKLAILIGEREYETRQTLPGFAERHLRDFQLRFIHADPEDRNLFRGIGQVADADLLLISVRRRVLKPESMKVLKAFEAAGKPILGIRTASHAFSLRNSKPPQGYQDWPELDSSVFGGSYTNHYGNKLKSRVVYTPLATRHPVTRLTARDEVAQKEGQPDEELKSFGQGGSLYKTAPLASGCQVLMMGSVLGHPAEPVAWTFTRVNGGKSFYTSLGHPDDFRNREFVSLLTNAIRWAAGQEPIRIEPPRDGEWNPIQTIALPGNPQPPLPFEFESREELSGLHTYIAFRSAVRIPKSWTSDKLRLHVPAGVPVRCWLNGTELKADRTSEDLVFHLPTDRIEINDANWLMLGLKLYDSKPPAPPLVPHLTSGTRKAKLTGGWQWIRAKKDFSKTSVIRLPAKFGGSTDTFFELEP